MGLGAVEFGGPDLPPRRLRDLLEAQVDAASPGSRIDWATYYFRDRALAEALIRASDRGVRVRLVIEPDPRRGGANDAVIAILRGHGLKGGLRRFRAAMLDRGHLHAKIYAFSDPDIAWVGSFNPSGDEPDDADVITEIGDQDRGHNLLLGIQQPRLTAALRRHVASLGRWTPLSLKGRLRFNLSVEHAGTRLYFYPRLRPLIAEQAIGRLAAGDRFRGAISHLKKGEFTKQLQLAVERGVSVELLVHDTERRVPSELVEEMLDAGIRVVRIAHPDDLPMHAKLLLIDHAGERSAWVGSHNFNKKSLKKNAELLLRTVDLDVIAALDARFGLIAAMAARP
jgi:hypothetical protein